jgi:hypothetical protein
MSALYKCDSCGCETTAINVIRNEQLCGYCVEKIHPLIVKRFLEKKDLGMQEKQTEKGVLKYRMPDIAEGHRFLSHIKPIKKAGDMYEIRGKIIEEMEDLVSYSELGYSTYKELLKDRENMTIAITEIGQEIFDDILVIFEKKN